MSETTATPVQPTTDVNKFANLKKIENCKDATIEELKYAIKNKLPIGGIETDITHPGCHVEEFFLLYAKRCSPEGKLAFPSTEEANVNFLTKQELLAYQGDEGFYKALQQGFFIFGTGGGPFDEHGDRDKRKSSAQIMCDYLGLNTTVANRMIYAPLLNFINFEDRNGNNFKEFFKEPKYAGAFSATLFSDNIKKGWKLVNAGRKQVNDLIADALGFIENEIESQRMFVEDLEEYKKIREQIISLPHLKTEADKKEPVMVVIHTDNDNMTGICKFLFSKNEKQRIKAVLKISSTGQLYMCPMNGTTLVDVVKLLRIKLSQKRGLPPMHYKLLTSDGSVKGLDEIYYHLDADSIMNGSLTQRDTPPLITNKPDGFTKQEVIEVIKTSIKLRTAPKQFKK